MFRAYDAERERLVAVKLFKLDLPPERVHQLVAEFERLIAAELTHPVLASPLATGMHDVSAYLVQDYVAADSLDLVVREYGPAPPADALRVAAQLAGALDFSAVVNITHGALHPRDVLLSSDDTRLTGAGVARAIERVGVAAPVRRPYTAPERVAGAVWDRRADVFSLAALIYELLWGRRVSGIGSQAVAGLTEIPGGDLSALRGAFARALAENPAARYETSLAFAEALKQAFPDVTVASRQAPVADPPSAIVSAQSAAASRERTAGPAVPGRRPADEAPQLPLLDLSGGAAVAREQSPVVSQQSSVASQQSPIASQQSPDVSEQSPDVSQQSPIASRQAAAGPEPAFRDKEPAMRETDLAMRDAEPAMRDVEPAMRDAESAIRNPQSAILGVSEPISALERSRSATWPLVLALGVGLMIGFAAGFGVGTRDRPALVATALGSPAAVTPPVPAGREFTESAVARPPAPAPAPGLPPSAVGNRQSGRGNPQPVIRTPPSALRTDVGRLLVRSTPAGARVFVDDKDHGRTPAVVRDLAHGSHRVRLVRDGYQTEERRVVMTPSRPSQSITVELARPRSAAAARGAQTARPAPSSPPTPGRFTGALTVVSRPPGASVFVDGRLVGTTPLSLPGVAAGSHAIRLEREGYRRWTSSIRVVASEPNRVTASLER